MSVNEKMTAIADKTRELVGVSGTMGLDAMAANLGTAVNACDSQADLIAQIKTALEGKAAGGGSVNVTDEIITITSTCTDGEKARALFKSLTPNGAKISIFLYEGARPPEHNNQTVWACVTADYPIQYSELMIRYRDGAYNFAHNAGLNYDFVMNVGDRFRRVVIL